MSYIEEVFKHYGITIDGNKCVCPFHEENTPSLNVYTETESYYCFGCGSGGNSVNFIRNIDKSSYPTAVRKYEDITGDVGCFPLDERGEDILALEFNTQVLEKIKATSSFDSRDYRGIRSDVSKFYGIMYQFNESDGSVERCFYPTTKGSSGGRPNLTGLKCRIHPKKWQHWGETGRDTELFGQWRFDPSETQVLIICSGEHDALATRQMMVDNTKAYNKRTNSNFNPPAVVSGTSGENALAKQIQANYDWVSKWDKIYFIPDSDDVGKKTVEALFDVIPKNKLFIMNIPMKDPNEMLIAGKQKEFVSAFFKAQPYIPDGVKSAADGLNEIESELQKPRITLPSYMRKMQDMMGGGIIQGRILNVIADTSTGKSVHVNRMVYEWIFNSPVTPTVVSLEATAAQYMLEILSIHMGRNLLWEMDSEQLIEFLESDEGKRVQAEVAYKEDGQPRFFIIDDRAGIVKDLEKELEMLFNKHGSKLFVIDVLSDLLRGSSEQHSEDHMNFQRNMAKNGVTICNVLHTRKPSQNPDGKPRKVTEYDALGTGSFVQSAAYNIVLNRDKLTENDLDRNTTEVDLPKCRGGKTGAAGKWFYEFDTVQCYDLDVYLEDNPHLVEEED